MSIENLQTITKKSFFFLVFSLFLTHLNAQNQSLGGGIGLNSLLSNGVNLIEKSTSRVGTPTATKNQFSQPQVSLNIDYNFPNKISNNWLGKIYNPIFGHRHLQMRWQAMFNQFHIDVDKNNSILSFGSSLLYFPVAQDFARNANFFIEVGYKAALNNGTYDPFHSAVFGLGMRHSLRNDWILQTNINYTYAFNEYVNLFGVKGFRVKNTDGFALFNVTILKSFLNFSDQGTLDKAKDSLGMARSFAVQAIDKGQLVSENTKTVQLLIQKLNDKIRKDKILALKISETALVASYKAVNIRLNLSKSKVFDAAERELDSLYSSISALSIDRLVDYDLASDVHSAEVDIAKRIQEVKRDFQDTRQNLILTYQYLPYLKELEQEVQRINVTEAGEARVIITKLEQMVATVQNEYETAHNNVLEIKGLFEKAAANLENANDEIEKTQKEIKALRKY